MKLQIIDSHPRIYSHKLRLYFWFGYIRHQQPQRAHLFVLCLSPWELACPATRSPGRQARTHLHNFRHPDRVRSSSLETPLLQETGDNVDGLVHLHAEMRVWQELVFDIFVQMRGWDVSELPHDARGRDGRASGCERASGSGQLLSLRLPQPGCSQFRFLGREELS